MSSRRRAREVALQILYGYDLAENDAGRPIPTGEQLAADIARHFDHFGVEDGLRVFAAELVAGTLLSRSSIDQLIETNATNWKLSRMSFIDRNLLRMSIHEMNHFADIPKSVTIDEAIELAKQFGSEESPSFINGILDAVAKGIEKQ
ncbi:MAG: transcription antitermination factor NusB [Bdellovibrionales bacterium RIFOXYD1_FULL_53_11]|nr:MAG: transcription antitermination factor NusB [Bdellovibrionales bacterium RIFOXYD1_FULL_53_11]